MPVDRSFGSSRISGRTIGRSLSRKGAAPLDDHALWAARISAATPLADRRLNLRLGRILEGLARQPTASIPRAAGGWGQAKATYRFLDHRRVTAPLLIRGMAAETARLTRGRAAILVVQDTTSLNFTRLAAIPELGPIGTGGLARGLLLHTTLAVTEAGEVLGVLGQQCWARPAAGRPGPELKESSKWIHGIDQAREAAHAVAGEVPRLIHVMDREGDVYEVLQAIDDAGDGAIIRCAQGRRVEGPIRTAHEAVRSRPVLESRRLSLPRSHGRAARDADVETRVLSATLMPDREKLPHGWEMAWTLVEVWEPGPPPGVEGLHWLLWTREPAATAGQAREVVRKYTCRWPIEEYHLTLKSGCRVEALQLESWDRLEKALVLYSGVAARVVALRDRSRSEPEAPATVLLSPEECEVLAARFGKGRASLGLSLAQAVLWIGRLGGHLNRKGDGMPGVRSLWRGMRDLGLLVEGYRVARRLLE